MSNDTDYPVLWERVMKLQNGVQMVRLQSDKFEDNKYPFVGYLSRAYTGDVPELRLGFCQPNRGTHWRMAYLDTASKQVKRCTIRDCDEIIYFSKIRRSENLGLFLSKKRHRRVRNSLTPDTCYPKWLTEEAQQWIRESLIASHRNWYFIQRIVQHHVRS